MKVLDDPLPVGPILIGPATPAHILTPSVPGRGIVNMTVVAEAQSAAGVQEPLRVAWTSHAGCPLISAQAGIQA